MLLRQGTLVWLFALFLFRANAQIERVLADSPIAPFQLAKSDPFTLQAGDILRVTGKTSGGSGFVIAPSIYRVKGAVPDLVSIDDPEVVTPAFEWTVNQDGEYYVSVQNASAVPGVYRAVVIHGSKAGNAIPDPSLATVKLFYATNRQAATNALASPYFTGQPAAEGPLSMGSCLVTIPRDHQMGEVEGPSIFKLEFTKDAAKHVYLKSLTPETNARKYFAEVAARAALGGKNEAFVFIHGFNVSFEDAILRTAQLSYDLGFSGAPILYSWPSAGKLSLLAYTADGRNADVSAAQLKSFLDQLTGGTGIATVHLIAHSMGNRVLTQALDQMSAEGKTAKARFRQIALLAPDVDADLFKQVAKRIGGTASRITLYASSRDEALIASRKLAGFPRAGQSNPVPLVVPGIDSIDASAVNTSTLGAFHAYYADNETILSDLFQLIRNTPPENRFGLTPVMGKSGAYWKFRPAKR